MKPGSYTNPRHINFWILMVFIAAVALRSTHFIFRTSMWFDELTAALNVRDKSFYQLATESLEYNQVAAVGFLLLQKLSTILLGVNDHAYRLFPFLFSIVSLFLFLEIGKHFFKGIALLCVFALCACSAAQIFYSGEAKQYSGDMTAALFLVWAAIQLMKPVIKRSTLWLIVIGGFFVILCSLPAVAIAPSVLAVVFYRLIKKQINLKKSSFILVAASWAFACLLLALYAKFVISNTVQDAMSNYWSRGFMPLNSFANTLLWIPKTINKELLFFLTTWMSYTIPAVKYISLALTILSVPGIVYLFKKHQSVIFILFIPLLVAILLAACRVLPFDARVGVYATWPLVFSGIAGIQAMHQWWPGFFPNSLTNAVSLSIAFPILLIIIIIPTERPPYNAQPVQLVLHEMKKQWQPDDKLFVYFKTRHALNFYGAKEGITNYKVGNNYQTIEPYLRQLDSLKGNKRVWFIFSQWTEKQPFPDSMKAYLGKVIGKEIGKIPDPHGGKEDLEAAAHLYDLSKQQ